MPFYQGSDRLDAQRAGSAMNHGVAVRTNGDQIAHRIDRILLPPDRDRFDVVNLDEARSRLAVRSCKAEVADCAPAPVVLNTRLASAAVPLEAIRTNPRGDSLKKRVSKGDRTPVLWALQGGQVAAPDLLKPPQDGSWDSLARALHLPGGTYQVPLHQPLEVQHRRHGWIEEGVEVYLDVKPLSFSILKIATPTRLTEGAA